MKTVFFDVDTQLDFVAPAGALYVPGAENILPAIGVLNRFGIASGATVISTMDAHSENDAEFRSWPPHCVVGTTGQCKPAITLTGDGRQIFLPKVTVDCFTNPDLEGILRSLNAERYVVYGVVTEICVRNAIVGLRRLGKPVLVVTNAVRHLSEAQAAETIAMAEPVTLNALTGG